ncbi:hypothetical protein PMAYCL1PPCAC_18707, partial [Pristionchus mayeri]
FGPPLTASAMANVCNKNQKRKLTPKESFKTIESMISDLSLFTSATCGESFEDDDLMKPQRLTECISLQNVVSDKGTSLSADRAYDRLMDSDFERSYILVPQSAEHIRAEQAPVKINGQKMLRVVDDQSTITSGSSAAEKSSSSASSARTPLVSYAKEKKQRKERKSEQRRDSDRPSAGPSYMTVLDNNLDLEVRKASSCIDSGFDAKISVKRKNEELCNLNLAADVANGTVRCLTINRQTFR